MHLILKITGFYFKKHTDLPAFIQKNNNKVFERNTSRLCTTSTSLCASVWEELCAKVLDLRHNHVVGLFAFTKPCAGFHEKILVDGVIWPRLSMRHE